MNLKYSLRGHTAGVTAICLHIETLYTGDSNGNVIRWDINSRRPTTQTCDSAPILKLQMHNQQLVSQNRNNTCSFRDPQTLEVLSEIWLNSLHFCQFDCNATEILLPSKDSGSFNVWNHEKRVFVSENTGTPDHGALMCLKWADTSVLAGYEDGTVLYWTGKSSNMLHLFQQPVTSVDYLLGNMAFACANGSVCLIPKSDPKRVIKFPDGLSMISINPNESSVALAAWDGTILIVPFKNGRTEIIAEHRGAIRSVSWLNETTLFASSEDSRISVWN